MLRGFLVVVARGLLVAFGEGKGFFIGLGAIEFGGTFITIICLCDYLFVFYYKKRPKVDNKQLRKVIIDPYNKKDRQIK